MQISTDLYYNKLYDKLFEVLNTRYGYKIFNNQCNHYKTLNSRDHNIYKFLINLKKKHSDYTILINLINIIIELNKKVECKKYNLYKLSRKQIYDSKYKYKMLKTKYYGVNKNYNIRKFNKIRIGPNKKRYNRNRVIKENKFNKKKLNLHINKSINLDNEKFFYI